MERQTGLYKPEVRLNPGIPTLIDQISDPTLQEPLRKTILEEGLFQDELFEYRQNTWVLSRINMFRLTRQSSLLESEFTDSTLNWLVSKNIIASIAWHSPYASNLTTKPYYNQSDTLAWLCFIITYQDLKKTDPGRQKLAERSVVETINRIGAEHPLRQTFKVQLKP